MADDDLWRANFQASHGGFESNDEEPHAHIRHFESITNNQRYPDVPNTTIKLLLFPFSLDGVAKTWLDKEPPNSILTWDDLVSKFINFFFPPSKTTNLRNEITNFIQIAQESFSEAWERFKELSRKCPSHGKAVEERCTTCGSNHSYNVCPMNRGAYDYPVYHDNFQQFQQAAAVGGFVQGNSGYPPSSVASYTRPSGFTQPNPQASRPNQGYNRNQGYNGTRTCEPKPIKITMELNLGAF
ncbi:reverse transcriptase domain-containing protein [Tanacetum coccineum]